MSSESGACGGDGETPGCAVCGATTRQCCSRCRQVYYCGRIHQVQHWKTHKDECKGQGGDSGKSSDGGGGNISKPVTSGFTISKDPLKGRFLEVSEDLEAGRLLLKETPLVVGPQHLSEYQPVCPECYGKVTRAVRCSLCGFPLCSKTCAAKSKHHKPECQTFQDNFIKLTDATETPDLLNMLYANITIIRCLVLQKTDPDRWSRLLELDACDKDRVGSDEHTSVKEVIVESMKRYFVSLECTEELAQRVCGILQINAVEIRMPDINIQGVYAIGSLQEHNCVPNTHRTFDSSYNLIIRAAVPLKKGEHLTCVYTDVLWPTALRRQYLKKSKYFWCSCSRCKDPTELGTYMGSIRCTKCSEGYLICKEPLQTKSDWFCESCKNTAEAETVDEINTFFEDVLKDLDDNRHYEANEMFLDKFSGYFHDGHYHMVDVKTTLCTLYSQRPDLDEKCLRRLENVCEEVSEVAKKLTPGISRFRGIVLYQYASAIIERVKFYVKNGKRKAALLETRLEKGETLLKEAEWILSFEPENQPESKLAASAKVKLSEIKDIRQKIHKLPTYVKPDENKSENNKKTETAK